ncbi:MAG: guanylate kinase [Kiritimatiellae bacterium]|nr:guanylate kinase [Kiritimatiellia bacterium]
MNAPVQRPLLLVVSAPSGAGKTTLCARLMEAFPAMVRSVSCTTRAPRPDEVNGRDYVFLDAVEFQQRIAAGTFLEYAQVHGASYGTPREPVEQALRAGRDVLLIIDVQGAERIRQLLAPSAAGESAAGESAAGDLRRAFVDVFIMPPDSESLRRRLVARGQDDAAEIERRLKNAGGEMAGASRYQYRIVNDRLEDAVARLRAIVLKEKQTSNAQRRTPNVQ